MENIDDNKIPSKSPFSIYEDKFCNRCSEYNGCIGLISSTSTSIGIDDNYEKETGVKNLLSSNNIFSNKMFVDIVKGMGVSLYTHKFKMILDCMKARKLMNDI